MIKTNIKRLRGFTLIEVIVVMALSGIIMTLAIKVILAISSIASAKNLDSAENKDILLLHTVLEEEFCNSFKIMSTGNDELIFYHSQKSPKKVIFQSSKILVMNGTDNDTIPLQGKDLEIRYLAKDSALVNGLTFNIQYNGISIPLVFKKDYAQHLKFRFSQNAN